MNNIVTINNLKRPQVNSSYVENKNKRYDMNDLKSVYTHYDSKTCKNIPTENIL